ncbi:MULTISPECIES: prephenate dehydratase [unclassified Pseudactinotalea]|uniref:prephenate dehydratase n=1 Tax=unclassified Pseudactinotalea TaxID=2649176 RepID=UPI00128BD54B|nr:MULTISPECIES: prephenate dehydratase [unclassified Pseudactinotalea]MPV49048.1 prephenate dehydratase [Pseudactinotalea sp. HY160]QGH68274.1 prephenate dehydratase [Pseudactinotalea sp. HY158]
MGLRYAYLGPAGTFTEAALRQVWDPHADEALPMTDVPGALEAVRTGAADRAVVPIENSIEGGVSATLDTLASGLPLVIVGEALVRVQFVLAALPGTTLGQVRRIATHPHAWAQCRRWVGAHLPGAVHVPATSTAAGGAGLIGDEAAGYDAAITAPLTAIDYGLDVLAEDIGDNSSAVTRFVVASRPGPILERTGQDKTTLMVQLADNEAGALLTMLEQFAARGVNLSRIESRPAGDVLGRYMFSIDAEGHIDDERVAAALVGLHRVCPRVQFLGSYPRVDGPGSVPRPGFTDEAFRRGRDWVASLREGVHPD